MSIVFLGTPEFAVPSLRALLNSGEDIRLVVTQTDKRKGRGHILSPPPVKIAALKAGLEVVQPVTLKDNVFIDRLTSIRPEFIAVVAYGRILTKTILEIPEQGCINVHASLLPRYRGAAPIQWAIINGEKKTGVTTMVVTEKLDTGPILLQKEEDIRYDDTAESLGRRLSELGASLLIKTLKGIRDGSVKPVEQAGETNYVSAIKKRDGLIDWTKSAPEISNLVRGMWPWPGAYCHINDESVRFLKAQPVDGDSAPGVIARISNNELIIGTGHGLLSVLELQPSGKKPMPVSAFIQGRKLREGIRIQ